MRKHTTELAELMPLICEKLEEGREVTFSPHGSSMLPLLKEGRDTVTLAKPAGKLKKYDIPLYRRENGQFVLHRVVRVGDTYTCIGDNQFERARCKRRADNCGVYIVQKKRQALPRGLS